MDFLCVQFHSTIKQVKYNHLELRNMMEYLDFKNAKELRSKIEKKIKK